MGTDAKVTIGFSTIKGNLLSRAIRWFSRSNFSHIWVSYWHPLYLQRMVVEAGIHGNVEIPYNSYVSTLDNVVEFTAPDGIDLDLGLPALGSALGMKYDFGSLFGRIWVIFCKWLGRKVKNPLGNPKRDACVETVLRLLQAADPSLANLDPEVESPETVYEALCKQGWKRLNQVTEN